MCTSPSGDYPSPPTHPPTHLGCRFTPDPLPTAQQVLALQALWAGSDAPPGHELNMAGSFICYQSLTWADLLQKFPPGSDKTKETWFLEYNGINHYNALFHKPASVGPSKQVQPERGSSEDDEPLATYFKRQKVEQAKRPLIDLTTNKGRGRGRGPRKPN